MNHCVDEEDIMVKKLRVLLIVSVFLALFSGAASALEGKTTRIDVEADGKVTSLNTAKDTVGEVLESIGVSLSKDDYVTPAPDAAVTENMKITVHRTFMVTVKVDGQSRRIKVNNGTIQTAKSKVEESIKTQTKLIGANETDELKPDMTIELATSHAERYEEKTEIPFEVLYVENAAVLEGTEKVLTEGANGIMAAVFEKVYEGDKLVSTEQVETKTILEPVNKLIEKGTKPKFESVPVKSGTPATAPDTPIKFSKVMTMKATAYTSDRGDAGTHTATGERARVGLVAVDPSIIPLGTLLYVENYGLCRAADTGGAIKGNTIDLFFNTYDECVNYGRRSVAVYILEDYGDLIALEEKFDLGDINGEELFAS